jgi:hypothetical protein
LAVEIAMTKGKKFKARVRARSARTHEAHSTARRNIEAPTGGGGGRRPLDDPRAGYREHRKKFREESLSEWRAVVDDLARGRPEVSWTSLRDMISVLSHVAREAPQNHTFFPKGGGLDLSRAAPSHEPLCLELGFEGQTHVLLPSLLQLVVPVNDPLREWAYFRLEMRDLAPSGIYEHLSFDREELLELRPGHYVDRSGWDVGAVEYDDDGNPLPLPAKARVVTRRFCGSLLMVAKASTYNALDKYDGLHAKLTSDEFRALIADVVTTLTERGNYGVDPLRG